MTEREPGSDRLSGCKWPWDILQIVSWLLYLVASGWTFFIAGSDRGSLGGSHMLLFAKIVLTLFTCIITIINAITDPTDEFFYKDWNGQDNLEDNK